MGDLLRDSFGGLLGTKSRLQCSEQGLGNGYRKLLYFFTSSSVADKGNLCRAAAEAPQPGHQQCQHDARRRESPTWVLFCFPLTSVCVWMPLFYSFLCLIPSSTSSPVQFLLDILTIGWVTFCQMSWTLHEKPTIRIWLKKNIKSLQMYDFRFWSSDWSF